MDVELDTSKAILYCLVGMAVGLVVAPTVTAAAYGFLGGFGVWFVLATIVIYLAGRD